MLMSTRHDRLARVLLLGVCGLAGALASGCKEEFSDDQFGVLDLASFYDGGMQLDPGAGVPQDIPAQGGYIEGQVAEFYDFGMVQAIKNTKGMPIAVQVQPMYFFFDSSGFPLFSRPVREVRGGVDWMKGGKGVLNPNPADLCMVPGFNAATCADENVAEMKKSYPLRRREFVVDKYRGVADYQRPLVDLVPGNNDPPRGQYTGLWEMIEVTVPDDYEPDAIKQVSTLNKAIESGKFSVRSASHVINCPIVDERTNVSRGISARGIFHPRIELWYRRQLAFCFLANGWETLGNDAGDPYFAKQDDARFDTMDVARIKVGSGTELTVKVGRGYQGAEYGTDLSTFDTKLISKIPDTLVVGEMPKRVRSDPAGYTPMRWMGYVPTTNDFKPGSWKSVEDIDDTTVVDTPVEVKNLAVRGVAVRCSYPVVPGTDGKCGRDTSMGTGVHMVDPTGDPVCQAERGGTDQPLECNPDTCFCDAPFVGYGQACGPGIAQCSPKKDKFAPDGYQCFPPWGGFCQRACDPGKPNTRASENDGKETLAQIDTRCGEVPGFLCLGGVRTCVKYCNENIQDPKQCSAMVMVGNETREIQEGQTCHNYGIQLCAWPDNYTPQPFSVPQ
jgi:hypothetical protein